MENRRLIMASFAMRVAAPWVIVSSTRAPTSALPWPALLKDQEELSLRSLSRRRHRQRFLRCWWFMWQWRTQRDDFARVADSFADVANSP